MRLRWRRGPKVLAESFVQLDRCQIIPPLQIGFRSYANDSFIRNARIGRFCSIGRRVTIGAAKHLTELTSTHPFFGGAGESPETFIGNDVWVGDNVVVLAGVVIGDGSVIGAGAVVTKDVPAYAIIGGVPAKVLRYRFEEPLRTELLASRWWDFGDAAALADPEKAIQAGRTAAPLEPHFKARRL